MKKKVAIASLMSILVLVSMFLCLFYTPLSDEEIAQDGKGFIIRRSRIITFLMNAKVPCMIICQYLKKTKKPKST